VQEPRHQIKRLLGRVDALAALADACCRLMGIDPKLGSAIPTRCSGEASVCGPDSVARVPLTTGITSLKELWLPTTLSADFVISMPKVKTHHWSGVTLSLKNLFGVVPASVYGWPKTSFTGKASAIP
jgi:hypothetical protein